MGVGNGVAAFSQRFGGALHFAGRAGAASLGTRGPFRFRQTEAALGCFPETFAAAR